MCVLSSFILQFLSFLSAICLPLSQDHSVCVNSTALSKNDVCLNLLAETKTFCQEKIIIKSTKNYNSHPHIWSHSKASNFLYWYQQELIQWYAEDGRS